MRPRTLADPPNPATKWIEVTGCRRTSRRYDGLRLSSGRQSGASGGSGGPPGSVEVAIPWSSFAGMGFGPGVPFRFTMTIARGNLAFPVGGQDFTPDGAVEDLMSEAVAMTTTTTTTGCPGMGVNTTFCELGTVAPMPT
jgi:hypothetical protein